VTSDVTSARGAELAAAVGRALGDPADPRIVDACESYAALVSDGREAPLADVDALDEWREGADPAVVNALIEVLWPARAPFPR
jgi:hypothetical protein